MHYFKVIPALSILLGSASAGPMEHKRQGGFIFATQTYFSGGGCTGTADAEATFGSNNLCQPIRSVLGTVVSVNTTSVTNLFPDCEVHYYTDLACTQGDTVGVIDHCEQASSPFVALDVIC